MLAVAEPTLAQPSLSSLWPLDVGRGWEFDVRVEGPFDAVRTGVLTQTVTSQLELAAGITISCFSLASTLPAAEQLGVPQGLSTETLRRVTEQPSFLFSLPAQCAFDVGVRVDEENALGVWSDSTADWLWWWIPANPMQGSTFRLPLRPGVADDAFANGAVRTLDGVVATPLGSFSNAVIVDYVVELGESQIVDEGGQVLGTVSFQVVGWVAFVPGVGPLASDESFFPASIDCPSCSPEIFETIRTTMDLRAAVGVSSEQRSFGSLKARY
jgi:hypothetical protein